LQKIAVLKKFLKKSTKIPLKSCKPAIF